MTIALTLQVGYVFTNEFECRMNYSLDAVCRRQGNGSVRTSELGSNAGIATSCSPLVATLEDRQSSNQAYVIDRV